MSTQQPGPPTEPRPVDPRPVDPQPVDPRPVDPQPVDPRPVDPQSPDDRLAPIEAGALGPQLPPPGASTQVPTPAYLTGPNLAAVILGLLCVVAGSLAILEVTAGLVVDWARVGPAAFTSVGLLFVLVGVVGIVRRRGRRTRG